MEFLNSDTHRERARTFAVEHVAPSVAARDREARWDGELLRHLGAAGFLAPGLLAGDCPVVSSASYSMASERARPMRDFVWPGARIRQDAWSRLRALAATRNISDGCRRSARARQSVPGRTWSHHRTEKMRSHRLASAPVLCGVARTLSLKAKRPGS